MKTTWILAAVALLGLHQAHAQVEENGSADLTAANGGACAEPDPCSALDHPDRVDCMSPEPNFFESLSMEEWNAVRTFLLEENDSGAWAPLNFSSWISIDRYDYPKAEVLAYLDGDAPAPPRAARADMVVEKEDGSLARIALKVDLPEPSSWERVPVIQGKDELFHQELGVTSEEHTTPMMDKVTELVNGDLYPIISHIYEGASPLDPNCTTKCMSIRQVGPHQVVPEIGDRSQFDLYTTYGLMRVLPGIDGGETRSFQGNHLHRLSHITFDFHTFAEGGPELVGINLMGTMYSTVEEVLAAWDDPANEAWRSWTIPLFDTQEEALYATFQPRPGPSRNPDKPLAAISFDPYGARYQIDRNKVNWMGWELELAEGKRGPKIYNIMFKGERIAYEISHQEAFAAYAGHDSGLHHTQYYDGVTYSQGYRGSEMVPGIDCALNAAYIDAFQALGGDGEGRIGRRAWCVFEYDTALPLVIHDFTAGVGGGGVRNTALVIRTKLTIGNYDYIQQLQLNLDGSMDVNAILSGYMQGSSYVPTVSQAFGNQVHEGMASALHDHTMNWKVDLDIGGTSNQIEMDYVVPWRFEDQAGRLWTTKRLNKMIAETEFGMNMNPATPMKFVVQSSEETNSWGTPRGYALHATPHHQVYPEDDPALASFAWTKYNVAVTKHSDQEWTSSMEQDDIFPGAPALDFDTYLDDEGIVGEDLVLWITSGTYHIPHSEDIPVTPTTHGNRAGFTLIPFNYFDENAAMDVPDLFTADGNIPDEEKPLPRIMEWANEGGCVPSFDSIPSTFAVNA